MFDWKWNRAWPSLWKRVFEVSFIGLIVAIVVAVTAWAINEVVHTSAGIEVPYVEWITSLFIKNSLKALVGFFLLAAAIIITAKAVWRQ